MVPTATVTFDEVILALHIASVVVAFGAVFTAPLFTLVGGRLDPTAMAWFHRMQQTVSRRIVSPGLLLTVIFGVILASEYHAWRLFYVQWGIGAAIVIGAIEGMVVGRGTGALAELAGDGPRLSARYTAARARVLAAEGVIALIVLATVFVMVIRPGH